MGPKQPAPSIFIYTEGGREARARKDGSSRKTLSYSVSRRGKFHARYCTGTGNTAVTTVGSSFQLTGAGEAQPEWPQRSLKLMAHAAETWGVGSKEAGRKEKAEGV